MKGLVTLCRHKLGMVPPPCEIKGDLGGKAATWLSTHSAPTYVSAAAWRGESWSPVTRKGSPVPSPVGSRALGPVLAAPHLFSLPTPLHSPEPTQQLQKPPHGFTVRTTGSEDRCVSHKIWRKHMRQVGFARENSLWWQPGVPWKPQTPTKQASVFLVPAFTNIWCSNLHMINVQQTVNEFRFLLDEFCTIKCLTGHLSARQKVQSCFDTDLFERKAQGMFAQGNL